MTMRRNANREAGRCLECGQPALVNYSKCKHCLRSTTYRLRDYRGFKTKCLYVVETVYGIKVGQSCVPRRRAREFRHTMLRGLDKTYKFIKSYEEKGCLEKPVQWELAEYCVTLPNGRLSHEIFSCDAAFVLATIDRVIAEDLFGVSLVSDSASSSASGSASSSASSSG